MGKLEERQPSTNLLLMKFMQRSRKRIETEEVKSSDNSLKDSYLKTQKNDVQPHAQQQLPSTSGSSASHATKDVSAAVASDRDALPIYISQECYGIVEDLVFGRLSFKQCNPEIEKLMLYYGGMCDDSESLGGEKDIDDEEMAEKLQHRHGDNDAVAATMAKNLQKKRLRREETAGDGGTIKDEPSSDHSPPTNKRRFKKPSQE